MATYYSENQTNFKEYAGDGYALITGGAGGIGKACALEFANLGINLYLIDYNNQWLQETKAELAKAFPNIKIKFNLQSFDL